MSTTDFRRAGAGRLGRWQARLAAARASPRLHRHRGAVLALAVLALIGLAVLLAPWLAPTTRCSSTATPADAPGLGAGGRPASRWAPTSWAATSSRLLWGGRISLGIGLASVLLSLLPGRALGLLAAFHPRWLAPAVMRVMDMMLALPGLLLAICVIAVLGPGRSTPCWRSPSSRCRAMCA
jgi:dipeptide transport system permease protein